nr:hypothetical protein [Scytonema hofmannii]
MNNAQPKLDAETKQILFDFKEDKYLEQLDIYAQQPDVKMPTFV